MLVDASEPRSDRSTGGGATGESSWRVLYQIGACKCREEWPSAYAARSMTGHPILSAAATASSAVMAVALSAHRSPIWSIASGSKALPVLCLDDHLNGCSEHAHAELCGDPRRGPGVENRTGGLIVVEIWGEQDKLERIYGWFSAVGVVKSELETWQDVLWTTIL